MRNANVFVLIGAGSTVFTPGLLRDLANSPYSDGYEVPLVDLDPDASETMAQLGSRMAAEAGLAMTVAAYVDRRQALTGARSVVTTSGVGSADGWRADPEIPAKHGDFQTVGDSVGPGGVLRERWMLPSSRLRRGVTQPDRRGEGSGGREAPGELSWGPQGGQDPTLRDIEEKSDLWEQLRARTRGEAAVQLGDDQEAESLVSIAESLLTGEDILEFAVNMPNEGKIPNLSPEAVIEVPAAVGASGITGPAVGALPAAIASVLTFRAQRQEITYEAAVTGDKDLALQALVLDPLVPDSQTARWNLDDAVAAHPAAMGAFA